MKAFSVVFVSCLTTLYNTGINAAVIERAPSKLLLPIPYSNVREREANYLQFYQEGLLHTLAHHLESFAMMSAIR
jgi:hypothetical protein